MKLVYTFVIYVVTILKKEMNYLFILMIMLLKKKEIFKQQKNPAPEQNRRLVSEARVKETERKRAARTRNMAGGGRRGYAIETRIPSWLE